MDDKVILKARGKITAESVEELKKSFLEQIDGVKNLKIVFDMAEVYYISSAGLRLVMLLRQKDPSIKLINLCPDVYEVFSVTGLTRIMDIRRMYKEISLDGLTVLGKGTTATVYRLNNEQIVKIYNEDVKEEDLLLEQDKTRKALLAGVPTMLSFDTVRAGDKLGAVYEAFNYETLLPVYVAASQMEREEYIKKYAQIIREMCSIEVSPDDFMSFKDLTKERLDQIKDRLDENTFTVFKDMIDQIPDDHRFVHGDCHMENLMVDPDGNLVVIDLGISGQGNEIFTLSGIGHYKVFIDLIADESAFKKKSLLSFSEAEELYHRFIAEYCEGLDEKRIELVDQGVYLYCCLLSVLEYAGTFLLTDEVFQSLSEKLVKAAVDGFDYSGMFQATRECISGQ